MSKKRNKSKNVEAELPATTPDAIAENPAVADIVVATDHDEIAAADEAELTGVEQELDFVVESEDGTATDLEAGPEEETLPEVDLQGTELDSYDAVEIEDVEFVEDERLESIIESMLFASDRPVSLGALKMAFKGTNIKTDRIKRTLNQLAVEYAGGRRGITLEEVPGGWQLRTKIDNMEFLKRTLKARPFRLSGPALEVLSIVAYKQPVVKNELDQIRGVESGHLLRALMEKNLVAFVGKSDLPGRPMQYGTTRRFLEIFGLRNLKELPTLSQIDELLPEGIGDEDEPQKQKLSDVTDSMANAIGTGAYSTGEEELEKIQEQLEGIATSSEFFEKEKLRQREMRDKDRAQNIRDALAVDESVPTRDLNWLKKYDEALAAGTTLVQLEEQAKAERFAKIKSGEGAENAAAAGDGEAAAEGMGAGAEAAGPVMTEEELAAADEEPLFSEDAAHPEDELGEDIADIDEDEEGEGHAGL